MTPPEFRNNLTAIGWTYRVLASRLGIPETKAKFWAVGAEKVPDAIAAWLKKAAVFHQVNPPPIGEVEHLRTEYSASRTPSRCRTNQLSSW